MELNIAGERFAVDYDGSVVSSPDFPGLPLEYRAPCGVRVSQEVLVSICRSKLVSPAASPATAQASRD